MQSAIETIPLNLLEPAPEGVRKVKNKAFIAELAASIKAHGLQQNLVVRKNGGKKFAVLAGQQRLAAMQQLVKAGDLKPGHLVPCRVTGDGDAAAELSLVENAVRDDMHPADAFEAFRALVDKGLSIADIAARFGRSEISVQRLLRLANVSPKVIKSYRDGKLDLEAVQAFAVTEDHKAQERVLKEAERGHGVWYIRQELTQGEVPLSDDRVKFVGMEAYEAAGGKVRRDLFAGLKDGADEDDETPEGAYLENPQLLEELVAAKLQRTADRVAKEGWKWVEVRGKFDYSAKAAFQELRADPPPLEGKAAERANALEAERDKLEDSTDWEDDEKSTAAEERMDAIQAELDKLEESRGEALWKPEQLARAGAVVTLGYSGRAEIHRGLVKPEDKVKGKEAQALGVEGAGRRDRGTDDAEEDAGAGKGLSKQLVASLTASKSVGLAVALAKAPHVALAATVHALAMNLLMDQGNGYSPLELHPVRRYDTGSETAAAFDALEQARIAIMKRLPDPERTADFIGPALWDWCLAAPQNDLLEVLALCAALVVTVHETNGHHPDNEEIVQGQRIAQAAGLDMKPWFTTTAENYFGRVSKALVMEALEEIPRAAGDPDCGKLKKGELAKFAEQAAERTNWLPPLLRVANSVPREHDLDHTEGQ